MSVLDEPLVFVDIETNGFSHNRGRIIEVAAIRANSNLAANQSFNSMVDPETQIPSFITKLTGITNADISTAPVFADIADELYELLDGAVFIAHNVRFDYTFLKHEFARVGKKFDPRMLCTVRLSQALYPQYRSHKLGSVIERCGIEVKNRHRAYDDAYALWMFIVHSRKTFSKDVLRAATVQL